MIPAFRSAFLDRLPVEAAVAALAAAGFAGVEINGDGWPDPARAHVGPGMLAPARAALRAALSREGVRPVALSASVHLARADPADRRRALDHVAGVARLAAEIGAPLVTSFTGRSLDSLPDDEARAILLDALATATREARREGVAFAVEGCAPHLIRSVAQYEAMAEALGPDAPGVAFDPTHFQVQGEDPVAAAAALAPRVLCLHVKDAAGRAPAFRVTSLGRGEVDLEGVVGGLRARGYDGPAVVEHEAHLFGETAPEAEVLARSRRVLRSFGI